MIEPPAGRLYTDAVHSTATHHNASPASEWAQYGHHASLGVDLLHAYFVQHAYPLHSHDYFVIAVIEEGRQSFRLGQQRYYTAAGGMVFLNPGDSHTGEPLLAGAFRYRAMYPRPAQVQRVAASAGLGPRLPLFNHPRQDDPRLAAAFRRLHRTLSAAHDPLHAESAFVSTLGSLLRAFANQAPRHPERPAPIDRAVEYLDANYDKPVSLDQLAKLVALSRFHFLRSFHAQVGMPPHAYLENRRIAAAQRLIALGEPLAAIAAQLGFSSQSHFTRRFKQTIGVTPGRYARQVRA